MAIFNSYVGLPEGIFPLEGFNLFQENVEKNWAEVGFRTKFSILPVG
jgi:hypothetical protein